MYNANQPIINQLLRQKDNVENLLAQYTQPQQPIQNIINTGMPMEFEARVLKDNEEVENILINRRTMFLDKKNKKLVIKETDGKISEEYEVVMPLDEKDKKILEPENKLKEMEVKFDEYSKSISTNIKQSNPYANDNEYYEPSTTTNGKSISKQTK